MKKGTASSLWGSRKTGLKRSYKMSICQAGVETKNGYLVKDRYPFFAVTKSNRFIHNFQV